MTLPWSVPVFNFLQVPGGADPNDAAIIIGGGEDIPPCLADDVAAAIIFRPSGNQNPGTDDSSSYYIGIFDTTFPGASTVQEGFVLYDPSEPVCINYLWHQIISQTDPVTNRLTVVDESYFADPSGTTDFPDEGVIRYLEGVFVLHYDTMFATVIEPNVSVSAVLVLQTAVASSPTITVATTGLTLDAPGSGTVVIDGATSVSLQTNGTTTSRVLLNSGGVSVSAAGAGDDITLTAADDILLVATDDINLDAGGEIQVQTKRAYLVTDVATDTPSDNLTLTTAEQAIPGFSTSLTTVTANALFEATMFCDMISNNVGQTILTGRLKVDGATQSGEVIYKVNEADERATVGQTWSGTLATAGSHTFEGFALKTINANECVLSVSNTKMTIVIYESGG